MISFNWLPLSLTYFYVLPFIQLSSICQTFIEYFLEAKFVLKIYELLGLQMRKNKDIVSSVHPKWWMTILWATLIGY